MNDSEKGLLQLVDSLREEMVATVRELVAIPTTNPYCGDPEPSGEAAGQAYIAEKFHAAGAAVRRVPVPADIYARCDTIGPSDRQWVNRDNVVAEWDLGGDGPTVIINTHMDTVGVGTMTIAPFDPVVRDGRIYGRGSSDSKGTMVMGLMAVRALLTSGLATRGRIIFESVIDEECSGGGAGTLACCEAGITADAAIVVDGGRGLVVTGCRGITPAWVRVRGRAGHSSRPGAVNAIDKAIAVKQVIDRFLADYEAQNPGFRNMVSVFYAGTIPAVIPGEATMAVNVNYPVSEAARAERELGIWGGELLRRRFDQWLAAQLPSADEWFKDEPVDVKWTADLYPYALADDHPLVAMALQAAEDATGIRPQAGHLPAWYDGSRLARRLGIPVIGLGHGDISCAHADVEWVNIADLADGARTLALTLVRLLG